jgi:hypothetical protein
MPDPPITPTVVAVLLPGCPGLTFLADPFTFGPEAFSHLAAIHTNLHDLERVIHEGIRAIHEAQMPRLRGLAAFASRRSRARTE